MSTSFSFPFSSPFGSGFSFVPGGGGSGAGGSSLAMLNATSSSGLAGQLDQLIDPNTGDYVRNDIGEWAETADSRTSMFLMLEIELGASPFDPGDGTTIKTRLRDGDPVTPEEIQAETLRAGAVLQAAGILTDLEVSVRDASGRLLRDQSNQPVVRTSWRDLCSGSPVDLILQAG